jgi:hypothetical protein
MPLLPVFEIVLPLIVIGVVKAVPMVEKVLAAVLPPASRMPLPPMLTAPDKNSNPEMVLPLMVPVVMFAVVVAEPCAKT